MQFPCRFHRITCSSLFQSAHSLDIPQEAVKFYKSWDRHGALSNFSPHAIAMLGPKGQVQRWASVEHYYQAHKFVGSPHPEAAALVQVGVSVMRRS